ncbi:MAG: neutral/alkaline non-lysosomal ceramidase N-terminal domain-containing protein [Armatimonadetes bacterium]|nr:neutral/alkaline non-lysosomal ceramidase N-terminal domain-containing protein [Armatimonadota bacterium]
MLQAGAAQAVITPPVGTPLAGYFEPRKSTGIHDDLFARALVLDDGRTRLALVSCDLICIPRPLVEAARACISDECGIAPDHVMVCCSHIHTGPYTEDLFGSDRNARYLEALPDYIAGTVWAAWNRMEEARIGIGIGEIRSIAFNRRFRMKDGTVRTNPGIGNPDIIETAGPIDPELGVIKVARPDGTLRAVWVNYTVHTDVVGGTLLSGDYPGVLARCIQAQYGPETVALFANGACGDINHINIAGPKAQGGLPHAAWMGRILAAETMKVLEATSTHPEVSLKAARTVISVPIRRPTEEQLAWARNLTAKVEKQAGQADPAADPYSAQADAVPLIEMVYAEETLAVARQQAARPEEPVEAQAIRIGDAAIVTNPAELFVEFGLTIKSASPHRPTFVVELANGIVGYVPTDRAFDEGGYEPRLARSSKLVPEAGDMIVKASLEALERAL